MSCFFQSNKKKKPKKNFGTITIHSPRGVKHYKVRCCGHRFVEHLHRVGVLVVFIVCVLGAKHTYKE